MDSTFQPFIEAGGILGFASLVLWRLDVRLGQLIDRVDRSEHLLIRLLDRIGADTSDL